jgi:hypothetical protein
MQQTPGSDSRGSKRYNSVVTNILPLPPAPPQQFSEAQSPQLKAHQLNLLTLQELPLEPALSIEPIPVNLAVGTEPVFCLVHQPTGLRVPGQFSAQEAECILRVTEGWDWTVNLKTREPACRHRFLWLLEGICKESLVMGEVAA